MTCVARYAYINHQMLVRFCLIPAALALLSACTAIPPESADWPRNIPPRLQYKHLYAIDPGNQKIQTEADYLTWVIRFYRGFNAIRGWHAITAEVLDAIPDERYAIVAGKLDYLGYLISGEWAKDSRDRVIFTRSISAWGDAAIEAVRRAEPEQLIDEIITDVEALLSHELDPDVIRAERYYSNLADHLLFDP